MFFLFLVVVVFQNTSYLYLFHKNIDNNIYIGNLFDGLNYLESSFETINNRIFLESPNIEPFFVYNTNNKMLFNINDKDYEITLNNTKSYESSIGKIYKPDSIFYDNNNIFSEEDVGKYIKVTLATDNDNIT